MSRLRAPLAAALAIAVALGGIYLLLEPPSTDLAAATFRAELFEREGFLVWSNLWYGGHALPGYSVLFPPLAALLGPRLVGVLAAVAAATLFAALAKRAFGRHALLASAWFALGVSAWLLTGRFVFLLGVALALLALLAADRQRPVAAGALAAATALASPVAALFLALAGAALALADRRGSGAVLALPALAVLAALGLAFPTEGEQPFPVSTFIAIPLLVAGALWLVPARHRALRAGVVLYGLLGLALFLAPTPVGSNVARLGALFAGPVAALVIRGRPALLALLAIPLLYWQLNGPVEDAIKGIGDPATEPEYYAPLLAALDRETAGRPARVHIPPTENRWEAAYVAPRHPLARGWLRQLESDDFEHFTDGRLAPDGYLGWLREHGVSYVALADAELDYLAEDEAELLRRGLPYLDEVWSGADWQLWRVRGSRAFGLAGAGIEELAAGGFTLAAGAKDGLLPIRWTPYWEPVAGSACLGEEAGWTRFQRTGPGPVEVRARLGLDQLLGRQRVCSR